MIIYIGHQYIVNLKYDGVKFRTCTVTDMRCHRRRDGTLSVTVWVKVQPSPKDDWLGQGCWIYPDRLYQIT